MRTNIYNSHNQYNHNNSFSLSHITYPDAVSLTNVLNSKIPGNETLSPDKYSLLQKKGYHEHETGYSILPDGTSYIAFHLPLPNITPLMFDWFFSWHPLDSIRYNLWHPDEHISVAVDEEDRKKLLDTRLSYKKRLWDTNVLYIEKTDDNIIHETIMSYHSPYDCGFELNDENSKDEESWTAVCANEGSICHYVRKTNQGSELRSRIWSGMDTTEVESEYSLPGSFHPEKEIESFVKKTAIHFITDFSNLASILPSLYKEYSLDN